MSDRLLDKWIGRYAAPDPAALAAVSRKTPAAIVTGGSAGFGRAIAERLASEGRSVLLVARDEARLEDARQSIAARAPGRVHALPLDITAPRAADRIAARLEEHALYGDLLVNAAGTGLAGPFASHSEAEVMRLVALNVGAVSRLTHWALPGMLARGRGGILNVASLGAYVPGPNQAAYYASRAYVLSLTEAVAAETEGRGVRVAAVAPGPLETGFHAAMGAERSLYRYVLPSMSAERAARLALRGFRLGRTVIVPGAMSSAMALVLRLTPHPISLPFVKQLLRRE